jgi:hypothetical protein
MYKPAQKAELSAVSSIGIPVAIMFCLISSCADDETHGSGESAGVSSAMALEMNKTVTQEASFVLYVPAGWTCEESAQRGYRTLSVSDDDGLYEASLSCGEKLPGQDGRFFGAKMEGPEGRLGEKRELLLTVLSNVRVTKGAMEFNNGSHLQTESILYRLRDGSASFTIPRGWRVRELGSGQFVASDPSGAASFMVAYAELITPALGVRYPGALISQPLSPHDALRLVASSQNLASGMQSLEIKPRADLVQQISQVYTLGSVAVEDFLYTCTTQAGRVKGYTMGLCFYPHSGTTWSFRHLTVGAPIDAFDSHVPMFIAMLQSYAIDEAWAQEYVRQGMVRLRQLQQQTRQMVSRNTDEIRQMMQAAYDERQRSADYIDHQRTNFIRGEQDWISALEGGTVYHTDTWGTQNTVTGEFYPGRPYDHVHFEGENPKYNEQMVAVDSREL